MKEIIFFFERWEPDLRFDHILIYKSTQTYLFRSDNIFKLFSLLLPTGTLALPFCVRKTQKIYLLVLFMASNRPGPGFPIIQYINPSSASITLII